ncbi:uncharacterized protein E0L32_000516 [Thyridium curvatum]|uniref:Uncharacterized protein n=1 Tax=Thyridium curvatum TaxID=1093900 RepID=A0A507AVY6_9PEZI|nr:uncharacterized protein E0L32_000516 [Thyridium curvatum]TPX14122.1 hypothetical protein E0L32_000516 [Thyridium curvatum]
MVNARYPGWKTLYEPGWPRQVTETGHRVALPHTGLNVALPLFQARQGDLSASERGFNSLFLSSDPELREMALAHMKGICRLGNEQAYITHQADQYSTLATSVFNSIGNKEKRRRRIPGDPSKIMMICSECRDPGFIREEVTPLFEVKSGKWLGSIWVIPLPKDEKDEEDEEDEKDKKDMKDQTDEKDERDDKDEIDEGKW